MFSSSFCLYAFLLYFGLTCCFARDTIKFGNPINSSGGPLVSASEKFELGFFTPNGSSHGKRYVGIWYYGLEPRTIVWVANRNDPVSSSTSSSFGIGDDGNLMVADGRSPPKKLTNVPVISAPPTMTLQLLDSGNLVLEVDNESRRIVVWHSFLEPTDTFLPGMKISEIPGLTSWKSQDDPAPGGFVFRQDEREYIITDNGIPYWKSRLSGNFIANDEIPSFISDLLLNITSGRAETCSILKHRDCSNKTLTQSYNYNTSRLVMGPDGKLRFFRWDNQTDNRAPIWLEPADRCSVFGACGKFSSCNKDNRALCHCLPGFEPVSPDYWNKGDFSEGCTRKSPVCSQHGKDETFLKLSMMKVQKPNSVLPVNDASECYSKCLEICNCHAYSYREAETYQRSRLSNVTCGIWLDDLSNIQESYPTEKGHDLYLRAHRSEKGNRTCETCGTNIIPYPLSTGPSCGDPMYFSFSCQTDTDTGQINFNASGRTYRVTSMNPEKRRFTIQVEKCSANVSWEKLLRLPGSSFFLSSSCNSTRNNFSTDSSSEDKWFYEVEIGWKPPLEPICGSSEDCKNWPNSFCNKAGDGKLRCICNPSFLWDPSTISCTRVPESFLNQRPGPLEKQKPLYLIFLAVTATMLFILCTAFALYHKRRRMVRRQAILELSLYNSERQVLDFINSGDFKEDDKNDIDVPHFDLQSILVATDNFAEANKLGQGGFGPVYKGKLPRGQEIAIKRLSRGSGQGFEEFKNEVVLIAKLQHRNLVRLLGYCIKGYEKMLIYEYMPNKSLDSFIFDRTRCALLNWEKRIEIILGIARGMLYLHQDSRLRIVHRDLKTSNILLDEEMNPKISDFGLAKIFGGKQTEASTDRVVGTYGYMSPEYALDGFFSIKSDVFSFGVVLLETISGKRNTGFYQAEQPLSLLGYAWSLWKDGRALDLAEQALRQTCNTNEFLRCVNVGLLCVQEDPRDRPTMSDVLFMLVSETPSLPFPKQPAFVVRRSLSDSASSSSQQQWNPEITTSLEEGR